MKLFFSIMITVFLFGLLSCESETDRRNDNNNFLPNNNVDFTLELARATNSSLQFNGGELFLSKERALGSIEGVYIFRASSSAFFAYELAEPNHAIGSCTITIDEEKGVPQIDDQGRFEYNCSGDTTRYDSKTGQKIGGEEGFPLRNYTVFPETNGEQVVRIRITG